MPHGRLESDQPLSCLGLVAALGWEVRPLLRNRPQLRRLRSRLYSFLLDARPVVLAISGPGEENSYHSARSLTQDFPVQALLSVGFAGALTSLLQPGDVVLADRVIAEGSRNSFPCRTDLLPLRFTCTGALLQTNRIIGSPAEKRRLGIHWKAVAVDMESAGVAEAARQAHLPFAAIKSITDSLQQRISIDFQPRQSEHEVLFVLRLLRAGMQTREGMRDLWRLAWASRRAAAGLAAAVDRGGKVPEETREGPWQPGTFLL